MAKTKKYSLKERLNLMELYESVMGMAPREQVFTLIGVVVVLLFLIVIPISCASSRLGKLQSQIQNHEKDFDKIITRIQAYKAAQSRMKKVEETIRPKSQVQLTTKLESLATQGNIGANIDSLKEKPGTPGEDFEELIVDVRMSKLTMDQLIEFLYTIESQNDLNLKINRLQLRPRYDNRQQFDADFEVSTLVSAQNLEAGE